MDSNYIEVFNTVYDFSDAINKREVNHPYKASEEGSAKFCGTPDYQTANDLLINGDGANLDKITAVNIKSLPVSNDQKNTLIKSVCGGVPLVPLAIMGVPKNMLATKKQPRAAKIVNIVYNSCFPYWSTPNEIITAGAKVAGLVKSLEARKVRVNLYACFVLETGGKNKKFVACVVNVKKAAAPLNMLNIAYPLINPSFLCRSGFRWVETLPTKKEGRLKSHYGYCADIKDIRKILMPRFGKDTVIIDGYEMITAKIDNKVKEIFTK